MLHARHLISPRQVIDVMDRYGKDSRNTTVLIDLLLFNVVHYSSLFQYFFSIYYGPYSS